MSPDPVSSFRDLARRRRQPVLVLPGLAATDRSTVALRASLRALGHPVHGWRLGRNEGPNDATIAALNDRFRDLADRYEAPIGIVGWSLGGAYAWALAGRSPERVRSVVAMGSPLATIGNRVSRPPPSVPVTSIWSRWDGVVPPELSIIGDGLRRENIEVRSLHLTLGFDPLVTAVVADRVAKPKDDWAPYQRPIWLSPAFP